MTKSIFKTNEFNKSDSFKQNRNLSDIIDDLSGLLKPIQLREQNKFANNKWPLGFVIGSPRSGTTLILQWLSSLGFFSYPTNVLNRFAYAPYVGALIQNMLFSPEFDFHNEFDDLKVTNNFESNLGKTKGALAPSEFQHFFRNYMPNFDPEFLDKSYINKVDFKGILNGLASIEHVFGKPFVMKNVMLQYNLLEFFNYIPNSIFIYIKRDPIFNMQSLLLAREKYYSTRNIWWSVKPKAYEFLKDMDIFHQVAGQVYFTNLEIENSLEKIPESNKLTVDYNLFCENPSLIFEELEQKYDLNGYKFQNIYQGEKYFKVSNKYRLNKTEIEKLNNAYDIFNNENL